MSCENEDKNTMKVIGKMDFYGIELDIYGDIATPWFKATDIAKCIEYSKTSQGYYNVSKMMKGTKDSEKTTITIGNSADNSITQAVFVSEFGLYGILFKSRLPKAEEFNEKVMQTLRQIRLTGGYIPIDEQDTEETINQKAQEIAKETVKQKDKLLKQLEEKHKKLEFLYEIEKYKKESYRKERDEAREECKALEEDINIVKDVAIEALHMHTKLQGTLGLKDVVIKLTGSSHGWQTYRKWMKDKYDEGHLENCGITYERYRLCSKEFIIDCNNICALEVLQNMFEEC